MIDLIRTKFIVSWSCLFEIGINEYGILSCVFKLISSTLGCGVSRLRPQRRNLTRRERIAIWKHIYSYYSSWKVGSLPLLQNVIFEQNKIVFLFKSKRQPRHIYRSLRLFCLSSPPVTQYHVRVPQLKIIITYTL